MSAVEEFIDYYESLNCTKFYLNINKNENIKRKQNLILKTDQKTYHSRTVQVE